MIVMKAFGYEYKQNGILLTVIYNIDGKTKIAKKFYEGATEINFDWEEESQNIINKDIEFEP